jgi:glutamyl-tRNA synthetase/glutamyl-Q tRNA(Asp) synthetase
LTRFAPAPTGALHLGHVVNAIYVWGLGHALGARALLRIEDHDSERSRREYEAAILDDLDWLGFVPDVFPTSAFRAGPCESRQSDRHRVYASHAAQLAAEGLVYGCVCSRQDLARQRAGDEETALAYPGTCRARGIPPGNGVAWRVTLDRTQEAAPEELLLDTPIPDLAGDPVIRDRRGNWTYQFAVTVDDFEQGVDLVIRGRDLAPSTGLQCRLARRIGRTTLPRFAHHPLVMKTSSAKLSKSAGDSGVSELRKRGWAPARVIGQAAWIVGLIPDDRPVDARDVITLFESSRP